MADTQPCSGCGKETSAESFRFVKVLESTIQETDGSDIQGRKSYGEGVRSQHFERVNIQVCEDCAKKGVTKRRIRSVAIMVLLLGMIYPLWMLLGRIAAFQGNIRFIITGIYAFVAVIVTKMNITYYFSSEGNKAYKKTSLWAESVAGKDYEGEYGKDDVVREDIKLILPLKMFVNNYHRCPDCDQKLDYNLGEIEAKDLSCTRCSLKLNEASRWPKKRLGEFEVK